jgi:hypothetical protein
MPNEVSLDQDDDEEVLDPVGETETYPSIAA